MLRHTFGQNYEFILTNFVTFYAHENLPRHTKRAWKKFSVRIFSLIKFSLNLLRINLTQQS